MRMSPRRDSVQAGVRVARFDSERSHPWREDGGGQRVIATRRGSWRKRPVSTDTRGARRVALAGAATVGGPGQERKKTGFDRSGNYRSCSVQSGLQQ